MAEPSTRGKLWRARRRIAGCLAGLPEGEFESFAASDLGETYKKVLGSGIQDMPLDAGEQDILDAQAPAFAHGVDDFAALRAQLIALMYRWPFQLPAHFNLPAVPAGLREAYVGCLLRGPTNFVEPGDADAHCRFTHELVDYMLAGVEGEPDSALWLEAGRLFTRKGNYTPLYFSQANLKPLCEKRARIARVLLERAGAGLDDEPPPPPAGKGGRIRVGVLVTSLHSVTDTYTTMPAVEHLDRGRFETVVIALEHGSDDEAASERERYFSGFVERVIVLPEGLAKRVRLVREAAIDILLIGNNITATANPLFFLCMHRLARVQIALNPCPVTTGIANVDCFVSGRLVEPGRDAQAQYSERLILLDGPGHVRAQPPFDGEAGWTPPTSGPPEAPVTFASAANYYKITPETRRAWLDILGRVEGSRLALCPFGPAWGGSFNPRVLVKRFRDDARAAGIDEKRIAFAGTFDSVVQLRDYLATAHVYLDSFPFSGFNSLLDPIAAGVPVVTLAGTGFRSMMGASVLRCLDADELIAGDADGYVDIAVALATDGDRREALRRKLLEAHQAGPKYYDSRWFSAEFEKIFLDLHSEAVA